MQLEAKKYLYDIKRAADLIESFSAGKSFGDYSADVLLRSGIERQFEIVGEAVSALARVDSELTSKIPEYRGMIAFRNLLIHGYATVDDRIVWGMIESKLSALRAAVQVLLAENG